MRFLPHIRICSLTFAALALSPPAVAQSANAPALLFPKAAIGAQIKSCRQGECNITRIDSRELQKRGRGAEFYKVIETHWRYEESDRAAARAAGRTRGEKHENYVVCSRRQPSYIFRSDDEWVQHMLKPGDHDAYAGYNLNSYVAYFAACHGMVRLVWDAAAARKLGYPSNQGEATQLEFKKLEEAQGLP